MAQVAAFGAIAWADATHAIGLVDVAPGTQASSIRKHPPEALEAWATAWRPRVAGQPIAVCLEPARGPRLAALLPYDLWVLYPRHPTPLAKYRAAFSPSRATDEPRAAASLLELRRQQRDRRQAGRPDQAKTRPRHSLVAVRRRLVHDRPRLSPRRTAWLQA
jgi:hypothetical protein